LFGGRKPSTEDADKSLESVEKRLEFRERHLRSKMNRIIRDIQSLKVQLDACRSPAERTNIRRRLACLLREKNLYEHQTSSISDQKFNVEVVSFSIDNAKSTVETAKVMREATRDLKDRISEMSVNDAEKMHDEMEDLMFATDDIQEVISRSFDIPGSFYVDDDDSLDSEIALLCDDAGDVVVDDVFRDASTVVSEKRPEMSLLPVTPSGIRDMYPTEAIPVRLPLSTSSPAAEARRLDTVFQGF
jgi:charged multivesicular body protein 5